VLLYLAGCNPKSGHYNAGTSSCPILENNAAQVRLEYQWPISSNWEKWHDKSETPTVYIDVRAGVIVGPLEWHYLTFSIMLEHLAHGLT
jgi:hypothetical protein